MFRLAFKPVPSKFGAGISLLWRGNRLDLLNRSILHSLSSKADDVGGFYLFESARSAIYNILVSQGIGDGDEVIISSFTCEAVTYAVLRTGACPVYVDVKDDLTMCDVEVLGAVGPATRAVIMQNTFGRLGFKKETREKLRNRGIFILEDCALAIGSKHEGVPLGSFGDVSVWSLEVSKTFTIGWGGVARSNCPVCEEALAARYATLGRISRTADLRRIFQLWFSILMMRLSIPGAGLVWYFLYGTRIFRRSNSFAKQHPTKFEKMGAITVKMFGYMKSQLAEVFEVTNRNYRVLLDESQRLGLACTVVETDREFIVAPRFSLYVSVDQVDSLIRYGESIGVEVGRWFSECPPDWGLGRSRVHGTKNALRLSKIIVNLPCHWSLEAEEIEKVKELLSWIAQAK